MSQGDRQYECIVFGATGYTGRYTTEHITAHLPTDFSWAVAGRSKGKLKQLVQDLQKLNPDRQQPGVEIAQLEKSDLVSLTKKTKVLISTVGPYHKYGAVVVEACAETGTHYLDVTGETPWVYEMIRKYHAVAEKTGAIMIPQNGVESAPIDLLCWRLVSQIRQTLNVGTAELIHATYEMNSAPSGGTLATILTLFDTYSVSDFATASKPFSMSPVTPPSHRTSKPLLESLTGVRIVPDLGILTDSLAGPVDIPLIGRTWGLIDNGKFYGPNFRMSSYMRTRNLLTGFGMHLALTFGLLALVIPPIRWLIKQFVYQPGEGPTKEQGLHECVEWRAIAHADTEGRKRAYGQMRWEGSLYHLTGVCLAEAALTISREKTLAHKMGGGILTPATLGEAYLTRLQKAGLKTEVRMLD